MFGFGKSKEEKLLEQQRDEERKKVVSFIKFSSPDQVANKMKEPGTVEHWVKDLGISPKMDMYYRSPDKGESHETLLSLAITSKNDAAANFLIKSGADVNFVRSDIKKTEGVYSSKEAKAQSMLFLAVQDDNLSLAKNLLKYKAQPNHQGEHNYFTKIEVISVYDDTKWPLFKAAENNNKQMVDMLMKYGADRRVGFFRCKNGEQVARLKAEDGAPKSNPELKEFIKNGGKEKTAMMPKAKNGLEMSH